MPKVHFWMWRGMPSQDQLCRTADRMIEYLAGHPNPERELAQGLIAEAYIVNQGGHKEAAPLELLVRGPQGDCFHWPGELPGELDEDGSLSDGRNVIVTLNPRFGEDVDRLLQVAREVCGEILETDLNKVNGRSTAYPHYERCA